MNTLNQKIKNAIFILFILTISTNTKIFAEIQEKIINPQLSNIIVQVEVFDEENDHGSAAELLLTALKLTNQNAKAELAEIKKPYVVPYALILHYKRLGRLGLTEKTGDESYAREAREVIDAYKKEAKGKSWEVYNRVYEQLINHFLINQNDIMIRKTFEEAINYDPRSRLSGRYIDYILHTADVPVNSQVIAQVNAIIEKHTKAGAGISSDIALRELMLWKKTGNNTFNKGLDYLKNYYKASPLELKNAIAITRVSIDSDKPEQIKKYKDALAVLAVKQPTDEERMELLGYILNEIKKINIYGK